MYPTKTIILVFLVLICAQAILPALTGVWSFGLFWIWLAAILVVFGVETTTMVAGIVGAILAEIISGVPLGSTATGFIGAALLYDIASRFISLRPLHHQPREWGTILLGVVVGLVLVAVIASIAVAFEALLYGHTAGWRDMMLHWYMPQVLTSLGLQLLVVIILFERLAVAHARRRNDTS